MTPEHCRADVQRSTVSASFPSAARLCRERVSKLLSAQRAKWWLLPRQRGVRAKGYDLAPVAHICKIIAWSFRPAE